MAASFAVIQEEIQNMLDIPDEELTPEQQQAMNDYLDELGQQEADKVDSFAGFLRAEAARAKACREESQRLAAKARTMENKLDWLKSHYVGVMQEHNLKKISGAVYTLSLRNSQSVHISIPPENLPEQYQRKTVKIDPDKTALAAALKAGEIISGCCLADKQSLTVR